MEKQVDTEKDSRRKSLGAAKSSVKSTQETTSKKSTRDAVSADRARGAQRNDGKMLVDDVFDKLVKDMALETTDDKRNKKQNDGGRVQKQTRLSRAQSNQETSGAIPPRGSSTEKTHSKQNNVEKKGFNDALFHVQSEDSCLSIGKKQKQRNKKQADVSATRNIKR